MNANLIGIVGLIPEDKLDWSPAPAEWSIRVIIVHIVLARHRHLTVEGATPDYMASVIQDARTTEGLQSHLATSWEMLAAFLSDGGKLKRRL
jgi:hypothetical protein